MSFAHPKVLYLRVCFFLSAQGRSSPSNRGLLAVASQLSAKIVPPARFLYAETVHQEIISILPFLSRKPSRLSGCFFELMSDPRGIAAAVAAKNMPPARFLHAETVLQSPNCTFYTAKALKTPELSQFRGFSF